MDTISFDVAVYRMNIEITTIQLGQNATIRSQNYNPSNPSFFDFKYELVNSITGVSIGGENGDILMVASNALQGQKIKIKGITLNNSERTGQVVGYSYEITIV